MVCNSSIGKERKLFALSELRAVDVILSARSGQRQSKGKARSDYEVDLKVTDVESSQDSYLDMACAKRVSTRFT